MNPLKMCKTMSAVKKEDVFNEIDALQQFIKSLSADERKVFAEHVKNIKKKVQQLLNEDYVPSN
jgi:hypothetical protein